MIAFWLEEEGVIGNKMQFGIAISGAWFQGEGFKLGISSETPKKEAESKKIAPKKEAPKAEVAKPAAVKKPPVKNTLYKINELSVWWFEFYC